MRWLLGSFVVLGLSLATSAHAQLGLNEGPLIRFTDREHFFGDMPQEDQVQYTFTFANGGTDTLRIENVEASCGCTVVAPIDRAVAPGDSSGIEVTFHSRDYKGERTQIILVYTNDPSEPRIDLAIHANVIPFVQIADEWIDFGEIEAGTEKVVATLVTADPGTDFQILGFENDRANQIVEWKVVPASAPDKIAYRVEARLRPDAPLGPFSERVLMKVKHPSKEQERIGLRGHVFSYFLVDHSLLNFHSVQKGRTVVESLEIRCDPTRRYRIEKAIVHAAYFSAQLIETGTGYRLDVTLDSSKVDSDEERFRYRDFAVLETTDPRQPEIVIELTGVVKQ